MLSCQLKVVPPKNGVGRKRIISLRNVGYGVPPGWEFWLDKNVQILSILHQILENF